jgi:ABC-type multidrug transport system fused ATPase/permease subunit
MFTPLIAKIFGVSTDVITFVLDNRRRTLRRLLIVLPLTAWTSLLYQINPLFLKWQVDSLTENWTNLAGIDFREVWGVFAVIVGGYFLINLVDASLNYFKDRVIRKLNQQTEGFLEDRFNNFLTRFDGAFLDAENNLRLIRNLQWDFKNMQQNFTQIQQYLIEIPVSLITLLTILPLINPYLFGIILVTVVISLLIDHFQSNSWRQFELVESRKRDMRFSLQWRIVNYFNALVANGWLGELYKTYQNRRKEYFEIEYQQFAKDRLFTFLKDFFNQFSQISVAFLAGFLVLTRAISIGTFTVFGFYVDRVKNVLASVGSLFKLVLEMRFTLFRLEFLLNIKPRIDYSDLRPFKPAQINGLYLNQASFTYPEFYKEELDYLQQMQKKLGLIQEEITPSGNLVQKTWQRWRAAAVRSYLSSGSKKQLKREFEELENLFSNTKAKRKILNGLELELVKGQTYALVGYNGAGKTTLSKLLKRMLDPTEGQIQVRIQNQKGQAETMNLRNIDPMHWREYISSLEQQSYIWGSLSVRENLQLGSNQIISDEEMLQAIQAVGLENEVTSLDAIINENLELSGGQRQLLELARVYLQRKPIVILDEGTNQLDALKEAKVIELLQEIKRNSVVIFITHRMTTSAKCDQILVLDEGQIKAAGTHRQLISGGKNLYQKFWQIQVVE